VETIHTPVLLEETLRYLAPKGDELMVDATLGEGGHSEAFLRRFPGLRVAGVDADREIQERAKERLACFGGRLRFFVSWAQDFFSSYPGDLESPGIILIDLGISRFHYEASGRGFSFLRDEYLDMRLDTSRGKTAASLIAALSEKDLADLLYHNAGERYSRRIAGAICAAKKRSPVESAAVLADIVAAAVPPSYRRGPPHPATRTFQALRMAVNGEAENLPVLLERALETLKTGGRMGVISFHSGEDRTVKRFFRERSRAVPPVSGASGEAAPASARRGKTPIGRSEGFSPYPRPPCRVRILTGKPLAASGEERRNNPPSRSAKFRAVEKIDTGVEP
jgi:16S rRNA (cytosine1402-N4)-methyltransferase